jgi:hypothetical protein
VHGAAWAVDLLTVPTLTFKTLYVLMFIAHGRRELVHVNTTTNPTTAWGGDRSSRRRPGDASHAICCAIGMQSTAVTSGNEPDGSESTPSPRPFGRLVRTRLWKE